LIRPGDVVVVDAEWPVIITDIMLALKLEHQAQVADIINVPRSTFNRWPHGSEPYWSHGNALMALHAKACGDDKTQERLRQFRERAIKAPS
jgi:hypothetical protein